MKLYSSFKTHALVFVISLLNIQEGFDNKKKA